MILSLSVITATLCFLYYYFTRTFNYWQYKNVKGPKPIPFFGNYKDVALRRKPRGMLFSEIYKQFPDEKVIGFYQMTSPALLIRDLDIVKQVMIKDFEVFPDRGTYFSKNGLGENIFHSDPKTWKILRNRFSSVFTSSKFKSIFHLLVDQGGKFVEYIDKVTTKQSEQDVYQLIFKYTVATALVSVFGWDIDTFNDSSGWFEVFDENLDNSRLQEIDFIFPGFLSKFNRTIISEQVINICRQIVAAINQQSISQNTNIFNVKDVLISLKEEMRDVKDPVTEITDDLLAGQVWVFYTAGYLNNTLILTYALYHLAHNLDIQDKLTQEINEVMEKYNDNLTYDVLKEMKYLDMVFEETLRINSLTHGLVRCAKQDVKLEGTDITINKGSVVVIPPYSIHHDEKYYPEPETFNPDRFLPENVMNRHPCAFLSFGAGRRSCLGSQLARVQFGICMVKLLQRFRIRTSENTCSSIKFDPYHMLLKPEQRLRLKFESRLK